MLSINNTSFGSITINNKKYSQVLILGETVEEREYDRLKELFGTSHRIGVWETEKLLADRPAVIVVGTGQDGKLETDEEFLAACRAAGVEALADKTPAAFLVYNRLVEEGKRVNGLFHTTC